MTVRCPKHRGWLIVACALALAACGPSQPRAWAESEPEGGQATAKADADAVSEESADGTRAVKLGEFNIRVFHTISTRKDTVTFVLYAVIGKDDYPAFAHSYDHRQNRVRDQVVVATRLVPLDDYDDPELKKFRRRIVLRLRRTLPELPIEDVYFGDFSLSSQST